MKRQTAFLIFIQLFIILLFSSILLGYSMSLEKTYNELGYDALTEHQIESYILDVWDCSNMSETCYDFFTELGINTSIYVGWSEGKETHCWLGLNLSGKEYEFESTLFKFKDISSKYEYVYKLDKWW